MLRALRGLYLRDALLAAVSSAAATTLLAADAIPMGWRIERSVDPASGEARCLAETVGGDVSVRFAPANSAKVARHSVRIGSAPQPGSLRYLRVGKRIFQTAEESFVDAEAAEIVALLKEPGVFVFEWFAGPDHVKHGGLFGTGDFALAAQVCEDRVLGPRL